ncbi:MAG: hypothetical protein M1825_002192 [Sarcosagium campestre]|nr:MAG: hypothetical protein M1825_002192 [Sarcosagium campestre]
MPSRSSSTARPSRSPSRGRTSTRTPPSRVRSPALSHSPRRSISPRSGSRSRSRSRTPSLRGGRRRSPYRGRGHDRLPSRTPTPSRSRSPARGGRRYKSRSRSHDRSVSPDRSASPAPKSTKIVVEKLTKNINEKHLWEIFGAYGTITDLDMPVNRQFMTNRGTAYIMYSTSADAESAIAHMHEAQLDGAVITVSIVLPRRKFSRSPPPARRGPANFDRHDARSGPPPAPYRGPGPGLGGGRYRSPPRGRRSPPRRYGRPDPRSRDDVYRPRSYSRSRSPYKPRSRTRSYPSRSRSPPRRRYGGGGGGGGRRGFSPPRGGRRRRSPSYSSYSSYSDRSRSRSIARDGRGWR